MNEDLPAVTRAVAEHAVETDVSAAPDDVLQLARRTLIDTVGISIAARNEDAVRIVTQTAVESGAATSTLLTTGARASAAAAALVNGTAAHALDYDDVTDQIYGHPSVVLWPAILAAGEQARAGGRDMLEAYVVGFDVVTALADGFASLREHYAKGWHSTATLGVVAAAAAVSRLLGSDVERTRCAIALAATMAGGSRQNFGTMTKPLHAGLAARDAVVSATLAANGFTADPDQLEAPLGYFAMFADHSRLSAVPEALREPWALRRHGINVKKFPACYNTQRLADATLRLAERESIAADEVRRITVTMEPGGGDPLIHHRPGSGLQAKFSAEYVAAAAVLDRTLGLRAFTDEAVTRPDARALVERATLTESPTPPVGAAEWEFAYAVVEVETAERGTFVERADVPRGDRRAPLSEEELEAKFRDAVDFSGSGWDASALLAQLWDIDASKPFTGIAALGGP